MLYNISRPCIIYLSNSKHFNYALIYRRVIKSEWDSLDVIRNHFSMIKVNSDRGIMCFDETILQVLIEESIYGNSMKATIVEHKLKKYT